MGRLLLVADTGLVIVPESRNDTAETVPATDSDRRSPAVDQRGKTDTASCPWRI